ncbi:MAG TPA: phosphonate metabolism protein/1,5-bisphosphokinase (PRPP-forming) PhnN [Rhodocyclaceae bacterium]
MAGRIYYIMGASGAGKDSLLDYARDRLAASGGVIFAHRYITRPADAGGENHVALTPTEFAARDRLGCFALSWQAHGLSYGIGWEINFWMQAGVNVVVNGSREYYPAARAAYPDLVGVLIEVSPEAQAARLAARDRETGAALAARLRRAVVAVEAHPELIRIDNDGPLEAAGARLVDLLAPSRSMTL